MYKVSYTEVGRVVFTIDGNRKLMLLEDVKDIFYKANTLSAGGKNAATSINIRIRREAGIVWADPCLQLAVRFLMIALSEVPARHCQNLKRAHRTPRAAKSLVGIAQAKDLLRLDHSILSEGGNSRLTS